MLFRLWRRSNSAEASRRCARSRTALSMESLEERRLLSFSNTDREQLLIELINRARANPLAEMALHASDPEAINDLNQGLPAGTITPEAKQPLAPHQALINAAGAHAQDMLDNNFFAHDNLRGETPSDRARAAGYPGGAGENIAWGGNTRAINQIDEVYNQHRSLFFSPGHRENLMTPTYREIGTGVRYGPFQHLGETFQVAMVAEEFGNRGGNAFITGVAFNDSVTIDRFYTIGEGLANVSITAVPVGRSDQYTTITSPAGGYALQIPNGTYNLTATGGPLGNPIVISNVIVSSVNKKIDFNTRSIGVGIVGGTVYHDVNRNGLRDGGEGPLSGQTVYLDADNDARLDTDEARWVTQSSGTFRINNLSAGTYTFRVAPESGWQVSQPAPTGTLTINLSAGGLSDGHLFGVYLHNQPPTAHDDVETLRQNGSLVIQVLANDQDPGGSIDLSSLVITERPRNGIAQVINGAVRYTPHPTFTGVDTFRYTVRDNLAVLSNPATVRITINAPAQSLWQNPRNRYDVNNSGTATLTDALLLINELNRVGGHALSRVSPPGGGELFLDPSGDHFFSAIDILQVITAWYQTARMVDTNQVPASAGQTLSVAAPASAPPVVPAETRTESDPSPAAVRQAEPLAGTNREPSVFLDGPRRRRRGERRDL